MRPNTTSLKVASLLLSLVLALLTYTSSAQTSGAFTPTGNMVTTRILHTATLLKNGQVLIAGGDHIGGPEGIFTAELYDPQTGAFFATGRMTTARRDHTATLLPDGKVLIAGGRSPVLWSSFLASAELYDPDTRTFTPTGDMTVARMGHTATLLNNGRVLIVGGFDYSPPSHGLASVELYDPLTGTFTATSNMTGGWSGQTATLLPDGKVLVSSAYAQSGFWAAETYDPRTDTFTPTDRSPRFGLLYYHTASLLPDGTVLIAGGGRLDEGLTLADAGIYDPGIGTFAATGNMTTLRRLHAATVLLDGTVLITGGEAPFMDGSPGASAEVYDPFTRAFNHVGDMIISRSAHTATRLNNGAVLIAGGSPTANAELYVPGLVVTELQFDRMNAIAGSSYSVNVLGSNLTPETFFDIRFTSPESNVSDVVLNWQRGVAASHAVPVGTAPGTSTINGVRAHQIETDHTGNFVPVQATITISPALSGSSHIAL